MLARLTVVSLHASSPTAEPLQASNTMSSVASSFLPMTSVRGGRIVTWFGMILVECAESGSRFLPTIQHERWRLWQLAWRQISSQTSEIQRHCCLCPRTPRITSAGRKSNSDRFWWTDGRRQIIRFEDIDEVALVCIRAAQYPSIWASRALLSRHVTAGQGASFLLVPDETKGSTATYTLLQIHRHLREARVHGRFGVG